MSEMKHPVTEMVERAERAYKGEEMLIVAACRAARCSRDAVCDAEEAAGLLIEHGWTWNDVLTVNS